MHYGKRIELKSSPKTTQSRLAFALERGHIESLKDKQLLLLNPPTNINLSLFSKSHTKIQQSFFPAYTKLVERGLSVSPVFSEKGLSEVCIVYCTRSKMGTLNLIYQAIKLLKPSGLLIIDGMKTTGIESVLKELLTPFNGVRNISKYHGKLIWFHKPTMEPNIEKWAPIPNSLEGGYITFPGIFSSKRIDQGSLLLAQSIPLLSGKIADFGSGWGFLSNQVLKSPAISSIDLIEADYSSVMASKKNIQDDRANFIWADVNNFTGGPYDTIISNPPFHISRNANPELGISFIKAAKLLLKPSGSLWIVANKGLPYESTMKESFKEAEEIISRGGFKVLLGVKPSRICK